MDGIFGEEGSDDDDDDGDDEGGLDGGRGERGAGAGAAVLDSVVWKLGVDKVFI